MSESFSIQAYLDQHPDMTALEILTPDMNGMFRVKRIPRDEAPTFFEKGLTGPGTMHLMNSLGDMAIDRCFHFQHVALRKEIAHAGKQLGPLSEALYAGAGKKVSHGPIAVLAQPWVPPFPAPDQDASLQRAVVSVPVQGR